MSVLALVLLSMTPIAAMGILIGLGRFERYLLEGSVDGNLEGNVTDQWSGLTEDNLAAPMATAAATPPVAHASRTAA
jgi:hypothetical protein